MDDRGLPPVIGSLLLVVVTVIIAGSIGAFFLDMPGILTEPAEERVFGDTEVVLGSEHRSWTGWNNGDDPTRGDIDKIMITYVGGETFRGDETGAIEVSWDDGSVRFLNPNRFDAQTGQMYHDGEVGDFCTGDFAAGETMTIRMVHNKWQGGGETDPDDTMASGEDFGTRYAESSWNDISTSGDDPFFRTDGRYPIEYSGSGIIESGDEVTVTFYGPEGKLIIAESSGTARVAAGEATEISARSC